jgi:hypothetical protein
MKSLKLLLLFLPLLVFKSVIAQSYVYSDYDWEKKPAAFKADKSDTSSEIIVQNKIVYQATIENSIGYEYYLRHTKTFVNSQQAIERNNKVYLPSGLRAEVLKLKVRVIKPNGDIVEMNDSDVKEATDEDSERKYKYLAVRGLEVGSVVEELFATKNPSEFTGRVYSMQSEYPARNCSFELIYPDYLIFDTKTYNGFPKLEKDTSYAEKDLQCRKATAEYIAPLKAEKYSNRVAHVQKVAYKLTGSIRSGNRNINSYDKISDILFQRINRELSKAENKAIDKIMSNAQVDYAKGPEDKIRKLEDYVKKTIYSSDEIENNSVSIDRMLETKITDATSLTRMYCAALNKMNIAHEILINCNHYDLIFEKDFESLSYLDEFFIYFPEYSKFLAPTHILYRYGFMPYQFRNCYGLFIKKMTLGNLTAGMGTVRFIEPDSYLDNTDSLIIGVDFSKGFDNVKYAYRITNAGHEATSLQSLFDYVKDEKDKDNLRKALIKSFADDAEIKDLKTENEGAAFFAKKPFVVNGNFTSGKYLNKAGGKYIFKVGELIGPQEQLYQEEARKLPIEMNYCKNYFRIINFRIPDGYKMANAEKLNMDIFLKDNEGERKMAFRSWYEIKGSDVTVYAEEYYKVINVPVDEYEPFKAVINAAADFNKIVLLFEPN